MVDREFVLANCLMYFGVACFLVICLLFAGALYTWRREKYLQRLNTDGARLELENLRKFGGPFAFVRPKGVMYFGKEFSKAIYERLTRVLGMVIVICWPAWVFVQLKLSKPSNGDDVELGPGGGNNDTSVGRSRQPGVHRT